MHQDVQVIRCPPKAPGRWETHGEASKGVRYDEIKRKWTEACHSVGGGYVRGQTSASSSDDNSPASAGQVEHGWALRRTRKSLAFSEKPKSYLLDMFWMREETSKKATASCGL